LIIMQRERAKRLAHLPDATGSRKKKGKEPVQSFQRRYSIISSNNRDRAIAAGGALAILAGVLLNIRLIPLPVAQPYWWVPTALGILAFSWAFKP
jgi:hypothetical protein